MPNPVVEAAQQIADLTADYHSAQGGRVMTRPRVLAWAEQLPEQDRAAALAEIVHVLRKTYVSEARMGKFLDNVVRDEKLTQKDPTKFWADTEILEIQERGSSQREMVSLLRERMTASGIRPKASGTADTNRFVYLDDCIFTGTHLLNDLRLWIKTKAPQKSSILVVTTFVHCGAIYRTRKAKQNLYEIAKEAGKEITLNFWRIGELEDRIAYSANSDVFRPKGLPDNDAVREYLAGIEAELQEAKNIYNKEFKLTWRSGNAVGPYGTFSSGDARSMLEGQLLISGCEARLRCPHLNRSMRPLGYQYLASLGFGGTVVTYRNCPNNCPLAWWAGDPWLPLFPRRTNTESALTQFLSS